MMVKVKKALRSQASHSCSSAKQALPPNARDDSADERSKNPWPECKDYMRMCAIDTSTTAGLAKLHTQRERAKVVDHASDYIVLGIREC